MPGSKARTSLWEMEDIMTGFYYRRVLKSEGAKSTQTEGNGSPTANMLTSAKRLQAPNIASPPKTN